MGNGNRTRNRRSHSPVLCQLSYSHRRLHYSNFADGNSDDSYSDARMSETVHPRIVTAIPIGVAVLTLDLKHRAIRRIAASVGRAVEIAGGIEGQAIYWVDSIFGPAAEGMQHPLRPGP